MSTLVHTGTDDDTGAVHCSWCGGALAEGDHARCVARLSLVDPPRYCPHCARRMVVQVDPMGWTARCSRHGETTSASAPGARR